MTNSRKKIGLALSGGGARGFAHIGVLKIFEANGVKFDYVAGTSAGSIIGGALASGMSAAEMEEMALRTGYFNMMRPSFGLKGLISTVPMDRFLRREFPVDRFEDLPIPFAAVSYNITTGSKSVHKGTGDLVQAIRASCAVPGLFAPVRDEHGDLHVDGGVTTVMPVRICREMGADVVIGIDVLACGATLKSAPKFVFPIMVRYAMKLIQTGSAPDRADADLIIEPRLAHLRPDQIKKRDEFIKLGELAGKEAIESVLMIIGDQKI